MPSENFSPQTSDSNYTYAYQYTFRKLKQVTDVAANVYWTSGIYSVCTYKYRIKLESINLLSPD